MSHAIFRFFFHLCSLLAEKDLGDCLRLSEVVKGKLPLTNTQWVCPPAQLFRPAADDSVGFFCCRRAPALFPRVCFWGWGGVDRLEISGLWNAECHVHAHAHAHAHAQAPSSVSGFQRVFFAVVTVTVEGMEAHILMCHQDINDRQGIQELKSQSHPFF